MAKPELDDGFTRIANEILEALFSAPFHGSELRCLFYVFRQTYGYQRLQVKLTGGILAKATGLDPRNCRQILTSFLERKILIQVDAAQHSFRFQKNHAKWCFNGRKADPQIRFCSGGSTDPHKRIHRSAQADPQIRLLGSTDPPELVIEHRVEPDGKRLKVVGEQMTKENLKENFKENLKKAGGGVFDSSLPENRVWANRQFNCFLAILHDLKATHRLEPAHDSKEANALAKLCTQRPSQPGYDVSLWGKWLREHFFEQFRLVLLAKNCGESIKSPILLTCHRISKEIERKY